MAHLKEKQLKGLVKAAKAASPGPWAYTEHCGAQVCIGLIHDQEPGQVRLKKDGVFLFEIEPSVYEGRDDDGEEKSEEDYEAQAFADAKFIALSHPAVVIALVEELLSLREKTKAGA